MKELYKIVLTGCGVVLFLKLVFLVQFLLGYLDSNQDKEIQSLLCCHYTIPQGVTAFRSLAGWDRTDRLGELNPISPRITNSLLLVLRSLEPRVGFEPTTFRLQGGRSTN